ncbi:uncharacterized protein ATC70_005428 [Mucor velutinosus]|uniref:Uncharacterized protein n=1 Tax=Mucor velutinosus TaxID=708070 RepID=A0AAN7HZE5_9FUNG|nr:hypothetical protein ATC70_005428 [Mucor velutinosus]
MDPKQQALIDAKRAEILAKLQKFQKPGGSLNPSTPPKPAPAKPQAPPPQQPASPSSPHARQRSSRAPPAKKVVPIPAPPPAGTSGGLNLVELQRRIAEAKTRLTGSPASANSRSSAVGGPSARITETKPPSMPFDKSGKIDLKAMMDTGIIPRRETTNSKALERAKQTSSIPAAAEKKPLKIVDEVPAEFTDPTKNPYFDPSMEVKIAPKSRRSRQLKFVQPGKYIDIANQERAKAQLEKLKQEITESVKKAGMQTEFDVSDKVIKRDAPPAVEWWDAPFLANKTYDDLNENEINPDKYDTLVTLYVHHPVVIQPPGEVNAAPVVRSLMLTTKERKKMRRQRRAEALKDKRDKIRLGLLEPDAPKVKISNLMRVLGEEAIQDPTKVEAKVRKEMELRQKMHDKANEQRKLTPEERRAKILNKLKEDQKTSNEVAVFKIKSCSHPKLRYKIEMNAQQHQLTGIVIVHPKCNIVIVEGGPKAIKAYKKLMLRRIDWNDMPPPKNLEADEAAMDIDQPSAYGLAEGEENKCFLVWTGQVKSKSFKRFTWRSFESEKMAREELGKWNVENYWDVAMASTDEELAARQPQL